MPQNSAKRLARRYDLDWLRVGAFGLLIFYHIGMFYVTWGFHVKSTHAGPAAEPFMSLLNPWRLSLLFFVSGVALRYAMDKTKTHTFAKVRTWRLGVPIVFGMAVVVAPQSWLQLVEQGEVAEGFWAFYPRYLFSEPGAYSIAVPTWNHLWYVVYLLVYTWVLCVIVAMPMARVREVSGAILSWVFSSRVGALVAIGAPAMWFSLHRIAVEPVFPATYALINDWGSHFLYFGVTLFAFVIAKNSAFWDAVAKSLIPAAVLVTGLGAWQFFVAVADEQTLNAAASIDIIAMAHPFARPIYAWAMIIVLLAGAQRWLNRPSSLLTYMTDAIFPWYIMHQTLIIIAGFWLTRQGLSVWAEFVLLSAATIAGCFILHEFAIRRIGALRPLFGLRARVDR